MKRFNFIEDNTKETQSVDYVVEAITPMGKLLIFSPFLVLLILIYFLSSSSETIKAPIVDPNLQESLSNTIDLYEKKEAYLENILQNIPNVKKEIDSIQKDISLLNSSFNEYVNVDLAVLLKSISKNIPVSVALNSIKLNKNHLEISGIARDTDAIMQFVDKLLSKDIVKILNIKYSKYTDSFGPYKQDFLLEGKI